MSRVEGCMSRVEGCMSRVEGCMSRVEGHSLRVRKSRSRVKSKGQNIKVCMFFYRSKERNILIQAKITFFTGCCKTQSLDDCFCV